MTPTRTDDPAALALKRQGMDTFLAYQDAQRRQDYGPTGSVIDQAVHMTGPLPDPQWQAFFQALQNQGVTKIAGSRTPADRVRDAETQQLRGSSVQPDYFSGGDTFQGMPTAPYADDPAYAGRVAVAPPSTALGRNIALLKNRALPRLEGHDTFLRRLYANDPDALSKGLTLSGTMPGNTP